MFDFGADPNYENKFGVTPLIAACKSGSKKCIKELLDTSKGNPSAIILRPNKHLKTVMDYIPKDKRRKMLDFLESLASQKSEIKLLKKWMEENQQEEDESSSSEYETSSSGDSL